jgi:hypothetical protein
MASETSIAPCPGMLTGTGAGGVERQVRIGHHLRILRSGGDPDGFAPTRWRLRSIVAIHRRDACSKPWRRSRIVRFAETLLADPMRPVHYEGDRRDRWSLLHRKR